MQTKAKDPTQLQDNPKPANNNFSFDNLGDVASDYRNAGSEQPVQNTVYQDAISQALKERNYKEFFNATIQNRIAEDKSRKYMQNYLASQGMDNSGYASSVYAGIANAANNNAQSAYNDYNQANLQADQGALERQEVQQTESDAQLIQHLNVLRESDSESVDPARLMASAGYVMQDGKWYKQDANGNADLSKPASNAVSQALALIDYRNEEYSGTGWGNREGFADKTSLEQLAVKNGKTVSDQLFAEADYLFTEDAKDLRNEGQVVELRNHRFGDNSGNDYNAFLVYHDGKWYQATQQEIDASNNTVILQSRKGGSKASASDVQRGAIERSNNEVEVDLPQIFRAPKDGQTYKYGGVDYIFKDGKWRINN